MTDTLHIVCPQCSAVNRLAPDQLKSGGKCGKCKTALFSGKPVILNSGNFQKQIAKNDIPIVVDFWADWCGPCKMMAPAFEAAAVQLEPNVRLGKLNTEQEQSIAGRYQIRSIPTLAVFKHVKRSRARPVQWT